MINTSPETQRGTKDSTPIQRFMVSSLVRFLFTCWEESQTRE